jgi:hypothetical protein
VPAGGERLDGRAGSLPDATDKVGKGGLEVARSQEDRPQDGLTMHHPLSVLLAHLLLSSTAPIPAARSSVKRPVTAAAASARRLGG